MQFSRSAVAAALVVLSSPPSSFMGGVQALPAFQSDDLTAGAYYAAGIVTTPGDDVFVTGSSYDSATSNSQCFVAKLGDTLLDWTVIQSYSSNGQDSACRGLAILSDQQLVVVGTSDQGGLFDEDNLDDGDGFGPSSPVQIGFGMTVGRDDLDRITGASLFTTSSSENQVVPYPEAVVVDPNDPDTLFVVSMTSVPSSDGSAENIFGEDFPNWTHLYKHGTTFEMTIEKLSYTTQGTGSTFDGILDMPTGGSTASVPTLEQIWTKSFPVEQSSDGSTKTVYIGGMIWKADVGLIVAGSTAALGIGYGPATGNDEDGYVSILDPSTGELVSGRKNNQRFGTSDYDIVTSICDDPNDPSSFYVVGATKGDMRDDDMTNNQGVSIPPDSLQAFIKKVNINSLYGDWTVQEAAYNLDAPDQVTQTTAWACAVQGTTVYVVGNVQDGAGMVETSTGTVHRSEGQDDIWIAQYDTSNGQMQWMQQVGSPGNDHVARGIGLAVDPKGNAVVLGDTNGSLYRDRSESFSADANSDIFLMTFTQEDGSFEQTITGDVFNDKVQVEDVGDNSFGPTEDTNGDGVIDDQDEDSFGPVDDDDDSFVNPNLLPKDAVVPASTQAHQSGPNSGAIFAASMDYDIISDQAIIIGISYTDKDGRVSEQPNCLIARLEIGSMQTKHYQIVGSDNILEACRDVILIPPSDFQEEVDDDDDDSVFAASSLHIRSSDIVVVGNSEPGGLYADNNSVQTGFGMALHGNGLHPETGASLFSNSIPYPQAVVADAVTREVYVASMNSNNVQQNSNTVGGSSSFPNWTYLNKYGDGFHMTIEKLALPDFRSVWSQTYPVDPESDGSIYSVHVGGLVLKDDNTLVAVGSTRAKGPAYGPADGDDSDGYITLLNPATGELVEGRKNNIRIGSSADDVISAICDVPDDADSIIVVGATKGDVGGIRNQAAASQIADGSLQWFAKKISLNSLTESWSIQGGAVLSSNGPTSAFAVGCHVLDNVVYVGGNVESGAELLDQNNDRKDSMGGNDVFVAKLDLGDGSTTWLRQFGSVGDDQLARNGGITTDIDGDVLLFGDTTGGLYRDRGVSDNADIFLIVLSAADGEFGIKGTSPPGSDPTVDMPVSAPTEPPVAPPTAQEDTNENGEAIPDDIVAIQLGPDVGPSYAGGMDYDPEVNAIYLTGATYGSFSGPGVRPTKRSSCFFARLDLPELEVIQRDTYGVDMSPDACSAIAANSDGNGHNAIVIGSTEANGLMTELVDNSNTKQYGFAMDLSYQHKFEFLGGSIVGNDPVTFPVAVVADEESFWTVSMTSKSEKVRADYDKVKNDAFPNLTNGGVRKYGASYQISVESFKVFRAGDGNPFAQGAAQTFISEWSRTLAVGEGDDGVLVTGMITVNDSLVIVGSTYNKGNMDGFMAKVSREDGKLDMSGSAGQAIEYVTADETSDDWIMNACVDLTNQDHFFIVGASQGKASDKSDEKDRKKNEGAVHAMVAKIDTVTLRTVWQKQFNAENSANIASAGYGCDVVPTENSLYIAGTVENGGRMVNAEDAPRVPTQSEGGDDIFVAQLSSQNGRLNWMKQVGSSGDDRVARSGAVKVDSAGNAIVFGETTGDLYRSRQGQDAKVRYSEPFVIMFDKHFGIHQPVIRPQPVISTSNMSPSEFYNSFTAQQKKGGQIFGIVVLVLVLLAAMCCVYKRCCGGGRRREKKFPSIYDAAAADLGYEDDVAGTSSFTSGGSRGIGLGLFKDNPEKDGLHVGGPNLNYRDDDGGESGGLSGNFHKTYSDLPQNGKEII